MDAFAAADKRLAKRGNQLWADLLAGVLDSEQHALGLNAGLDPHPALFRQVVNDRVVNEVRRQLEQERLRADGGGELTGGFDRDAAFFRKGKQSFAGLFSNEG